MGSTKVFWSNLESFTEDKPFRSNDKNKYRKIRKK